MTELTPTSTHDRFPEVNKMSGGLILCDLGFWDPTEKIYHWYLTNLNINAKVIYPLYRFHWQIELIFKSCKQSLNASRLTSNNPNIIESLLLTEKRD